MAWRYCKWRNERFYQWVCSFMHDEYIWIFFKGIEEIVHCSMRNRRQHFKMNLYLVIKCQKDKLQGRMIENYHQLARGNDKSEWVMFLTTLLYSQFEPLEWIWLWSKLYIFPVESLKIYIKNFHFMPLYFISQST